jgi:hypothetical protein
MPINRPAVASSELGVPDGSSPSETIGVDESGSVRKRRCPWGQRFDCAMRYIGTQRITYDAGIPPQPVRLERLTPLPLPPTALFTSPWWAVKVHDIQGHKPRTKQITAEDGSSNTFAEADVFIRYAPLPYAVADDAGIAAGDEYKRYVSFSQWQLKNDILLLPSGCLKYTKSGGGGPHGNVVPFNTPLQQPCLEFRATWHRLPEDLFNWNSPGPWLKRILGDATSATKTAMNTCNNARIWSFDAGTLAVVGWVPERRETAPFGSYEYDVHFTFQWRPQGNNFLYYNSLDAPADSGYYYVSRAGTFHAPGSVPAGDSLFDEVDFRTLFRVQA